MIGSYDRRELVSSSLSKHCRTAIDLRSPKDFGKVTRSFSEGERLEEVSGCRNTTRRAEQ